MDDIELEIQAPEFEGAERSVALGPEAIADDGIKDGDQDMEEGEIEDANAVEKIEIREVADEGEDAGFRQGLRRNLSSRLGPRIQPFKSNDVALPVSKTLKTFSKKAMTR